jgi:hyaluronan synthase
MFTFLVQLLDLIVWKNVGLFLIFFTLSWIIFLVKIFRSSRYRSEWSDAPFHKEVSIIIPVVDEDPAIFQRALNAIENAGRFNGIAFEVIVVANGASSEFNAKQADNMLFKVIRLDRASKRKAIYVGVENAHYQYTIILDSDTIVQRDSIYELLKCFNDQDVGGVTSKHMILNRDQNFWRRISDWLEDVRFNEIVKGQSIGGAVACLPGRMFAIRTELLREASEELISQKFLGHECVSGDDRFLTSWLLRHNYQTVYQETAGVWTDAPTTFKGFVLQRLRWSRTSLRETILALPWIFKYPYMAFTTLATVAMRWLFFIVFINAILVWTGLHRQDHFLWHYLPNLLDFTFIFVGSFLGFLASGFLKNIRHLLKYPQDIVFLPLYLMVTTFILTPVEWFGNITLTEKGWMTRSTTSR